MYADGIDAFNLEARAFKLVYEPAQGRRCICAGENVFIHEQTPDQVFVLPAFTDTCDLQEEDAAVIGQHVIDLVEESAEVADTYVFGHLKASDFVVASFWDGDVAVVHAEDPTLGFWDTGFAETGVAPGGLIAAQCYARGLCGVVCGGILGQSAPAAADIEEFIVGSDADLLANDGELVVL